MVTNRYVYYLIAINALISLIIYVPRILLQHRFEGAWTSILLSVVISSLLIRGFTKMLVPFTRQGFPELMERSLPKWLNIAVQLLMIALWFFVGAVTLLSFVDITLRYISPDVPAFLVMLGYLIVVCWACTLNPASILFGLEILLVLNCPIVAFFIIRAITSPMFDWDAVLQTFTFSLQWPSFQAVAAATFLFTGYINLVVFNRVFEKFHMRGYLLISLSGLLLLLLTMIVPIGMHGTMGVSTYVYPWFSLADAIRIDMFLVERLVFVFYLVYISLFLISTVVHWHVAQSLTRGLIRLPAASRSAKFLPLGVVLVFAAACLVMLKFNQEGLIRAGELFLEVRIVAEIFFVLLIFYMYRKEKKK
ncbi:GerAB/ArcD/ProY family transporter [Paenibacillus sp. 1P03SA]|uniref:GerAB/ArcD/ProY family transporter n=1 Tax=Paenibacillus sp. 1P03SA TaxID=3132294 RepID=UPI0039A1F326